MPGAGKSTVGVILAKLTSQDFIDTDVLIQISQGRLLQDIVDTEGYMALRRIEEVILLGLHCYNHVIATGGSAVYSHAAMEHLRSNGIVVFLGRGSVYTGIESFVIFTREALPNGRIKVFPNCLRNVPFSIESTRMSR